MNATSKWLAPLALLSGPMVANADTVTYDFTAAVTSATGQFAPAVAGSILNGTYTINVSAGNPSQSLGPFGSQTSFWFSHSYGGTIYGGLPLPSSLVLATTLSGIGFMTPPISQVGVESLIEGGPGAGGTSFYTGIQTQYNSLPPEQAFVESYFNLAGTNATYSSDGLPLFLSGTTGTGLLEISTGSVTGSLSVLNFNITSLTPAVVPLPASAWLMLSGLGALWVVARRRKV